MADAIDTGAVGGVVPLVRAKYVANADPQSTRGSILLPSGVELVLGGPQVDVPESDLGALDGTAVVEVIQPQRHQPTVQQQLPLTPPASPQAGQSGQN